MASLINLNINVENLPKEKFVKGKKGVYYNFTISVKASPLKHSKKLNHKTTTTM